MFRSRLGCRDPVGVGGLVGAGVDAVAGAAPDAALFGSGGNGIAGGGDGSDVADALFRRFAFNEFDRCSHSSCPFW